MKTIHLHGSLGDRFGGPFSLEVATAAEAVRAIGVQLPGFREALADGEWQVVSGDLQSGTALDATALHLGLPAQADMHLMPVGAGAGGDVGKAVLGGALVAASFLTTGGAALALMGVGGGLAFTGVSSMLSSAPASDYDSRERPEERPSFLFDGPVNTSTQGLPVPIVLGQIRAGTVVISAGMTAEELDE